MGQRGLLDRLPVAHSTSVTSLDWCNLPLTMPGPVTSDAIGAGLGWLVSGGLDRTVKVWDLTAPGTSARMPSKPTYTLHPPFPVRRVVWRPGYECEVAVVSNAEFSTGSSPDLRQSMNVAVGTSAGAEVDIGMGRVEGKTRPVTTENWDRVEIWDVRRGWISKWCVPGSAGEGSVTGS